MCAAITMWDPLRHWGAKPGMRVGFVGIGGLGMMGIKLAKAMGCGAPRTPFMLCAFIIPAQWLFLSPRSAHGALCLLPPQM